MTDKAPTPRKNNNYLRLVVDRGKPVKHSSLANGCLIKNNQLELFTQTNSVIFISAKDACLHDIQKLIERYGIGRILDLRDVPYLNFGNSSRSSFFDFISSKNVKYISLFSEAASKNHCCIKDLFSSQNTSKSVFAKKLSDWISKGPTLVIISQDRSHDNNAVQFASLLTHEKISFSEISEHNNTQ